MLQPEGTRLAGHLGDGDAQVHMPGPLASTSEPAKGVRPSPTRIRRRLHDVAGQVRDILAGLDSAAVTPAARSRSSSCPVWP